MQVYMSYYTKVMLSTRRPKEKRYPIQHQRKINSIMCPYSVISRQPEPGIFAWAIIRNSTFCICTVQKVNQLIFRKEITVGN